MTTTLFPGRSTSVRSSPAVVLHPHVVRTASDRIVACPRFVTSEDER